MAETKVAPNNDLVKFRGKAEHEMAGHKPKKLPAHAHKMHKRGMISDKQLAKMKGEG